MSWVRFLTWVAWWTTLVILALGYGFMPMALFLFGSGMSAYLASGKE